MASSERKCKQNEPSENAGISWAEAFAADLAKVRERMQREQRGHNGDEEKEDCS